MVKIMKSGVVRTEMDTVMNQMLPMHTKYLEMAYRAYAKLCPER